MTHILSLNMKTKLPYLSHSFHTLLRQSKEATSSAPSKIHEHLTCKRCLSNSNGNLALFRRNNTKNYNALYVNNCPKDVSSRQQKLLPRTSWSLLTANEPERGHSQQVRGLKGRRDKVGRTVDHMVNPIDKLQSFVVKPILAEEAYVFKPTAKDISDAQQLFLPSQNNNIEFLKSALMEEHLPEYDLPEVAVIGRSNVGKSSLISMLLSHTDVKVRVSSTPGHTKLLNFFQIGKHFTLVDMPGYGFNMPKHYSSSVEAFLASRKNLKMTFLLMDGKLGPTNQDELRFEIMKSLNIDFCIVLTKIDKVKPAILLKSFMSVLQYRNQTSHCFSQPFLVSSINGEGIPVLQAFIGYVTGNIAVKGM